MSYCRFGWEGSDVYVFLSDEGFECCGCRFGKTFVAGTPEEMISHLGAHRRANHFVPEHAILALWEDIPGAQTPVKAEPASLRKANIEFIIACLKVESEKLHDNTDNGNTTCDKK